MAKLCGTVPTVYFTICDVLVYADLQKSGIGGAGVRGKSAEHFPPGDSAAYYERCAVSLESLCTGNSGQIGYLKMEYGRAGHCEESVWYHFHAEKSSALFSGGLHGEFTGLLLR